MADSDQLIRQIHLKRQFFMKYHLENYNEIWRTNKKNLKVAQVINFFILLPHE